MAGEEHGVKIPEPFSWDEFEQDLREYTSRSGPIADSRLERQVEVVLKAAAAKNRYLITREIWLAIVKMGRQTSYTTIASTLSDLRWLGKVEIIGNRPARQGARPSSIYRWVEVGPHD